MIKNFFAKEEHTFYLYHYGAGAYSISIVLLIIGGRATW